MVDLGRSIETRSKVKGRTRRKARLVREGCRGAAGKRNGKRRSAQLRSSGRRDLAGDATSTSSM